MNLCSETTGVLIEVRDNGGGIPESEIKHIFDRFFRVDNMERDIHHAGLGLAIAQHIIQMHGSEIEVVSKPEAGSRFSFSLPI